MGSHSKLARHYFSQAVRERDRGLTVPSGLILHCDIPYGPESEERLDVYRLPSGKLPVLFCVHGGGWVQGSKDDTKHYMMRMALEGFAAVNFTYRLSPEHKHPSQLEDINLVVSWILSNSERHGFDTSHVFAVGDSAGAHLLSLYACMATNPDYARRYSFKTPDGFVPEALILNSGVYFMTRSGGVDPLSLKFMDDFLPLHGTEEEFREITPINFITERFPPSLIMTSGSDFLQNHAPRLCSALMRENVKHTLLYYPGERHGFHLDMRNPAARECLKEEAGWIKRFLHQPQ